MEELPSGAAAGRRTHSWWCRHRASNRRTRRRRCCCCCCRRCRCWSRFDPHHHHLVNLARRSTTRRGGIAELEDRGVGRIHVFTHTSSSSTTTPLTIAQRSTASKSSETDVSLSPPSPWQTYGQRDGAVPDRRCCGHPGGAGSATAGPKRRMNLLSAVPLRNRRRRNIPLPRRKGNVER